MDFFELVFLVTTLTLDYVNMYIPFPSKFSLCHLFVLLASWCIGYHYLPCFHPKSFVFFLFLLESRPS